MSTLTTALNVHEELLSIMRGSYNPSEASFCQRNGRFIIRTQHGRISGVLVDGRKAVYPCFEYRQPRSGWVKLPAIEARLVTFCERVLNRLL